MIRRLQPEDEPRFSALLAAEPFLGGRIRSAFACYAAQPQLAGFCLADDSGALLILGSGALLCGSADEDELGAFLRFSGVQVFKGEGARPAGYSPRPRLLMRHDGQHPAPLLPPGFTLDETPELWPLTHSPLFVGVDQDAWYADACLRRNRGLAQVVAAVAPNSAVAATACAHSIQPDGVYLTAVATLPRFRNRGLARALTAHLATCWAGRPVQLLCAPPLRGLYEAAGFVLERKIHEYTAEDNA